MGALLKRSPAVPGYGKILNLCRECRFQCPITSMERKATKDWIHSIKSDTVHRKVMKTLHIHCFIDEDDMDFDETAESAVENGNSF